MLKKRATAALYAIAVIGIFAMTNSAPTQAQPPVHQDQASTYTLTKPIIVAAGTKYKYKSRRSGSGNLAGNGGGSTKLIPKGGCCQMVLNACATICNRSGGCTGNGDCSTNPN